jgi:hypothetical protein
MIHTDLCHGNLAGPTTDESVLSVRKLKRDSLLWNLALHSTVEQKGGVGSAGAACGLFQVHFDGPVDLQTAGMRGIGVTATSTPDCRRLAVCSHCGKSETQPRQFKLAS